MELSLDAVGSARAVLIAGPTASGKSAAALRLAEEIRVRGRTAWVVNADAMQVYDGLCVLTARPTSENEARIPHRLYGHVSPALRYSVGAWLSDVAKVIDDAKTANALIIAVGGTGLYFKALTEGLAEIPVIPAEVRESLAKRLETEGAPALHALLSKLDPTTAAALRPNDPQRVLRALEVLEATGRPLSEWQKIEPAAPLVPLKEATPFVIEPERRILYARIEERFDAMARAGAIDEVRALLEQNLSPDLPAMKAIGVREFAAFIRGESSLETAVTKAKTESRRYAKRQSTWLRHQMKDWRRTEG
jgi:tRNA dimethylallyltransferase